MSKQSTTLYCAVVYYCSHPQDGPLLIFQALFQEMISCTTSSSALIPPRPFFTALMPPLSSLLSPLFAAFRSAVDWNEPWIQGVLVFHLLLWIFFLVTRKSFGAQVRTLILFIIHATLLFIDYTSYISYH